MEQAGLTPEAAVEAISAARQAYIEQSSDLKQSTAGLRDMLTGWLGGARAQSKQDELMLQVYTAMEAHVADLVRAAEGEAPARRSGCALRAAEILLLTPAPGRDRSLEFCLNALEGLAEPLLPLLERDALAEVLDRYRQRTPPRRMLPNQKKLFKAMQARLEMN